MCKEIDRSLCVRLKMAAEAVCPVFSVACRSRSIAPNYVTTLDLAV